MRGLPATSGRNALRTRRWDALILGGALPGLITAVQLGRRGARVLVIEEESSLRAHPALHEPFLMTGSSSRGVLGKCLRELGVPLIDQRRLEVESRAFQMVLPTARIEYGQPDRTREELSNWGIAECEPTSVLLNSLSQAASVEQSEMLEATVVRPPRKGMLGRRSKRGLGARARTGGPTTPASLRGLPEELTYAPDRLQEMLGAQIRALSNCAAAEPSDEARARLLGSVLEGGSIFRGNPTWLRDLLKRRIESLFGEFRSLNGSFELIRASNQPGIAVNEEDEIWIGKLLVLNAPRAVIGRAVDQDPVPDLLNAPAPTHQRLSLHFRVPARVVPEGMGNRLITVQDPEKPPTGTNVVTLRLFADRGQEADPVVDLVASAVVERDEARIPVYEVEIGRAVEALFPFGENDLFHASTHEPSWDGDIWLSDPPAGGSWPGEVEIQISHRPPVYALERAGLAELGFEGDVMLGWRAGEAIAGEAR